MGLGDTEKKSSGNLKVWSDACNMKFYSKMECVER